MELLNTVLRAAVSALLFPFRGLPPLVGLAVVSLLTAVGMLLVFKVTSNQAGIAAVKRQIHACLFEIRLFNDDLRAILRAQGELLRHNLRYLKFSVVPLLWMIVPLFLLIAQLQFQYAYEPLEPGRPAIVEMVLAEGWEEALPPEAVEVIDGFPRPAAELVAPEGVRLETPGVWAPDVREMSWRLSGERPGDYELAVELGGERFTKRLRVAEGERVAAAGLLSPIRPPRDVLLQLVYPAEPPLPKGPVESISVSYPGAEVWFFGWRTHWMVVFFILSIAFAFALRNRLGVSI